jgi:single-strand DNA-binding protein
MATDLNSVVLIGRLTRDPEFKMVGQSSLVNISLANNKTYLSNNEKKEEVSFFDCVIWGKLAEVMRDYGKKGTQVMVQGRLEQDTWDGQDGKKLSKIKIRVDNFQLLGGKPQGGGSSNQSSYNSSSNESASNSYSSDIDSLPNDDVF